MITVLVTGLIGSGKSEVCKYLEHMGYPVFDCDSKVKTLYNTVPGLLDKCEKALGVEYSDFGKLIFENTEKREVLEAEVFPYLKNEIVEWKNSCGSNISFLESATATSKPFFSDCYDKILLVKAPLQVRQSRNSKVAERNSIQIEPSNPDYIIDNSGCLCELTSQIDHFLKELQ